MPFLWLSNSSSTTMGRKMSCSSKRNRLLGSCSSTLVSSTNKVVGPLRALRVRRTGLAALLGLALALVLVVAVLARAGDSCLASVVALLRRGFVLVVVALAVLVPDRGVAVSMVLERLRSSSGEAVFLAVLRLDEKASAGSLAAR